MITLMPPDPPRRSPSPDANPERGHGLLGGTLVRRLLVLALPITFIFLYLHLFILPATPVFTWGDQSIFLDEATRMLRGELIYRDFFEFVFPGLDTYYFTLFRVFGPRAWIPDASLVLVGIALAWVVVVIARKLMPGASALLAGLLFLTFPFQGLLDGTHHWYSTFAVMAALAVLIEGRSRARLAAAGALCGLATWFTQSRGVAALLGFAVYLVWEHRRRRTNWKPVLVDEAWLSGAFLIVTLALNSYFVWKTGLARFWYCTVTFVLKYYPAEPYNNWRAYLGPPPHFAPWPRLLEMGIWFAINALLPLVFVLFFVRYWRGRDHRSEPWDRLMLVNLAGVFLFLSVAPSPGYSRLCAVSPPAFILLVWFATREGRLERLLLRLLWVAALALLIVEPIMRQTHWRTVLDLPSGRTAYLDSASLERFWWIQAHTRPGDYFFGDTLVCFALGLREPSEIPFVTASDYTRPEQVARLINDLEAKQVRWVLWYSGLDQPLPHERGRSHVEPLRAYLYRCCHLAKTFSNGDQIWHRN